jgi:hypothetical protein
VLGGFPVELVADIRVADIESVLSIVFRLLGVMVMPELLTALPDAVDTEADLKVTASLPSCVAVPSLRSWTK